MRFLQLGQHALNLDALDEYRVVDEVEQARDRLGQEIPRLDPEGRPIPTGRTHVKIRMRGEAWRKLSPSDSSTFLAALGQLLLH